ncbi:hypothetical protein HK103_000429 [Boothiomyces macroporosus]|uniref:Protein PNS1 n=1 Tax=Boothiomyces macroporosus TaxID=261099 RepID=A0AAD5UFT9_9FUNG|nr:hypothetical protein HK103_000429 [Boothiomyces macroporosus]
MAKKVYVEPDDEESGNIKVPSFITKKRYCRDVPFLVIFVAFWFGMVLVAQSALKYGDPRRLIVPQDYLDNYCGYVTYDSNGTVGPFGNQTGKPYLYYFDLFNPTASVAICVSSCPNTTQILTYTDALCVYNYTTSANTFISDLSSQYCVAYTIDTAPVLNRCVPTIGTSAITSVVNSTSANTTITANTTSSSIFTSILNDGRDTTMQVIADLTITWPVIVAGAGLALLISLIWMIMLQILAGFFVWLTVIICNLVFDVAALWLYLYWQSKLAAASGTTTSGIVATASSYVGINNSTTAIQIDTNTVSYVFYTVAALAGLLLLITIALIKRIRIAIAIIKQASKAMAKMPTIALNLAYFIYIGLYIITPSGQVTPSIQLFSLVWNDPNIKQYELAYHIFGFLWTMFFLSGINQVTIAGAIATWYWTMDKKKSLKFPVMRSFGRVLLYHLGSIALGSLLIAIVEFIRLVLYEIQRRVKKTNNQFLTYLVACLQCCMKVVAMLVKFVNKNAYIYIAITGKAFFKSAGEATALIIKNALSAIALDCVSDFILVISKVFVAGITGFLAYLYLAYFSSSLPNASSINYPIVTVIFVAIAGLMVAQAFFSVYDMAINTITLSFLIDLDKNDGSRERPYFMNDELRRIMGLENVKPKKGKKVVPEDGDKPSRSKKRNDDDDDEPPRRRTTKKSKAISSDEDEEDPRPKPSKKGRKVKSEEMEEL